MCGSCYIPVVITREADCCSWLFEYGKRKLFIFRCDNGLRIMFLKKHIFPNIHGLNGISESFFKIMWRNEWSRNKKEKCCRKVMDIYSFIVSFHILLKIIF